MSSIIPIVEGQSEVVSAPLLLRRMLQELHADYETGVAKPFRVSRSKVVKPGELERAIELAVASRDDPGAVLVLLDSDDDDPALLVQSLQKRAQAASPFPTAATAAVREYECWLLASKESLRGVCGIRAGASNPLNVETIRDGKGRLERNMEDGRRYVEVSDQPRLTARLDFDMASANSQSFADLRRAVEWLRASM